MRPSRVPQSDPALGKPSSGDRSAADGQQHGVSLHSSSPSSKYLCTLYGVVRYDALGSAPGAAPLPAAHVVSRLCSLLRAMCHSDSQQLLQGKQAQAILELPAPPTHGTAAAVGGPGFVGLRPQTPLTPASTSAASLHAASPGSSVSMMPPPSPSAAGAAAFGLQAPTAVASNAAVFFPGGPSVSVSASAEAARAREAAATAAAAANPHAAHAAPALAFPSVPLFHAVSHTLMAHTQLPSLSSVQPSFVASTHAAFTAASAPANADRIYLLARETRLAPITAMVAGESNWASMVPPRFSRYTRVYKPLPPVTGPGGQPAALAAQAALAAAGTDLWAWREIELQSQAPVPGFLAQMNAATPAAAGAGGGSHLSSSLSASAAATAASASCPTPWYLSSLGKPLLPSKSSCHIRPLRLVSLSSNYESLLTNPATLGYTRDWEFVQEGFRFEDRDGIELLVFQVLRVSQTGEISSAQAIRGNRWIVEVRAIAGEDAVQNVQAKVASYAKGLEQSGHNTICAAAALIAHDDALSLVPRAVLSLTLSLLFPVCACFSVQPRTIHQDHSHGVSLGLHLLSRVSLLLSTRKQSSPCCPSPPDPLRQPRPSPLFCMTYIDTDNLNINALFAIADRSHCTAATLRGNACVTSTLAPALMTRILRGGLKRCLG